MGYDEIMDHSLKFMSRAFCIDELTDNNRPRDGAPYIIIDKPTDTMTILSLFDGHDTYDAYAVVPNVSTANLNTELMRVYVKEIKRLKERFMHIGKLCMCKDFEKINIYCDVLGGLFTVLVDTGDSDTGRYFWEKQTFALIDLARVRDINVLTHDIFAEIHSALLSNINEKD